VTTILNKEKLLEQAQAFVDEGKIDKAIREYEKILFSDVKDLRVKIRIAELYTKQKQSEQAIKLYREVALQYTDEGFYLKAVTVYKQILRLNPSLIEINEELAKLYERMGILGDAVRQYDIVANALDRRGDRERSLEIREKIVQLHPDDIASRTRLAEFYQSVGKTEQALDQFEELAKALEKRGGREKKLIELYEKILSHRPDRTFLIERLIRYAYVEGDKKRALKWLDAAEDLTPYDPELLGMQAEIYASLNQFDTAKSKYFSLAELYQENGDVEGALRAYAEILVYIPGEKEEVRTKISLLGPDAFARAEAWALKRRKELDEELKEREEEERKREVSLRRREDETRRVQEEEAQKIRREKIQKRLAEKGVVPSSLPPPPPSVAAPKNETHEADAAFRLMNMYEQMGLEKEADEERRRALELYEALQTQGKPDPFLVQRIEDLRGEKKVQKKEEKPKQDTPPFPKSKKKASFV